jgi:hypothetical protein
MPPGSTMVEILPPGVTHKGFRDMTKLLGHNYFSSHATGRPGQAYTKILPCLAYQSSSSVCALLISRYATSLNERNLRTPSAILYATASDISGLFKLFLASARLNLTILWFSFQYYHANYASTRQAKYRERPVSRCIASLALSLQASYVRTTDLVQGICEVSLICQASARVAFCEIGHD